MEMTNKRLAVLVGCNYSNTPNELHGCINDVLAMKETLVTHFGFDQSDVQVLIDAPGSLIMPTGANIKKALDCMVDQAQTGDVLFFHYSGHGTRIPSLKPANPFRHDEAIVPCDLNLITDVDLRQLVNRLPKGASFTIISDSCHSGGLIDKEKEQIGPSSWTKNITSTNSSVSIISAPCPKTIAFESIVQHLASLTGINDTINIGTHLVELFGADASMRFRLLPADDHQYLYMEPLHLDEGILLSGCQANETSADMNPFDESGDGGKAYGAFSNAVQTVLKKEEFGKISNKQLVMLAREVLHAQGIEQHPCLYCSDQNAGATFLCES